MWHLWGATCEPTTFSLASTAVTFLTSALFSAFNNAEFIEQRNQYIDTVKDAYSRMNNSIQKANHKVQTEALHDIRATCENYFGPKEKASVRAHLTQIQERLQESRAVFNQGARHYQKEVSEYLEDFELSFEDNFRFYQHMAIHFEKQIHQKMRELFETIQTRQSEAQTTFFNEVLPELQSYEALQQETAPIEKKVEATHELWNQMIVRKARYSTEETLGSEGLVEFQNKTIHRQIQESSR